MKKIYTIGIAFILSLSCCWYIGQKISDHSEQKEQQHETASNIESEVSTDISENVETEASATNEGNQISVLSNEAILDMVEYEGSVETTDNPYGYTAGNILLNDTDNCILLTPNTGAHIKIEGKIQELSFHYQIHPWVKDLSDGLGIVIWIMDENDEILDTIEIDVPKEGDELDKSLDLSEHDNASKFKIMCNNGKNNDDSGDWLVISNIECKYIH